MKSIWSGMVQYYAEETYMNWIREDLLYGTEKLGLDHSEFCGEIYCICTTQNHWWLGESNATILKA